jgi:predicted nucleotidyltransferase
MIKSKIFTEKELEVIQKKLSNSKLSQVDSNYLYKFIKPKLKEINLIDSEKLINKMKYNQKTRHIEARIKKTILNVLDNSGNKVKAIVLYGSVVQTNYKEYNDIDILVITKENINPIKKKYKKINEIKKSLEKYSINSDIEIYQEENFKKLYPSSPSLIYQLKDYKLIYGKLKIPDKINLYNTHLHMKLDWSYLDDNPNGEDIYRALRNIILVRLLLHKIIDNDKLKKTLEEEVGKNLIENLKKNQESKIQRKIALMLLKELEEKTREELGKNQWEKIKL